MAELHVQRKERSVWPWILGALIISRTAYLVYVGRK